MGDGVQGFFTAVLGTVPGFLDTRYDLNLQDEDESRVKGSRK